MKSRLETRLAGSVIFWISAIALLWAVAVSTPGVACETPVCRYAMYNWPRSPYYIAYFHQGEIPEEDAAANKLLEEFSDVGAAGPNLAFRAIDITDEEQLKMIPDFFNEAREKLTDGKEPTHMIFPPWYTEPLVERLDTDAIKKLADSPMRKRIGKLFNEGNSTVLILLTGGDEEANAKAEKVLAEVVEAGAVGEIPMAEDADLYYEQPAAEEDAEAETDEDVGEAAEEATGEETEEEEVEPRLKVGVLKVARTDPGEQWLVRMLLSVESDLRDPEFKDAPMVFAVYGRGRAMPPYVGRGITTDNLIECVAFLAGPCSCMVKDQNPGVDLLTTWDWDKTAEIIAVDDPSLEPDPWEYQEYSEDDEGQWSEAESTDPESTDPESSDPEPAGETAATDESPADETPDPDAMPTDAERAESERERAMAEAEAAEAKAMSAEAELRAEHEQAETFATRQAWIVGLCLAAGAVLVVVVGLVMSGRKQS